MFQDFDKCDQLISSNEEIKDGGAAMTAYAKMQFEEMSNYEKDELTKSLLNYCELDTMAMVMIYEGWKEWIN
jgi:predicted NUDIX family phosphoesterase